MGLQMLRHSSWFLCEYAMGLLLVTLLAPQGGLAADFKAPGRFIRPAPDEFETVKRSVVTLLQGRDTAKFARETTVTAEDWKAIASTNLPDINETLRNFADGAERARREAEVAAKEFLAKAESLHLDFSKVDLHASVVNPARVGRSAIGNIHYGALQAEGETLPNLGKLEIILNPDVGTNSSIKGEFKVVLHRLSKFPAGWRVAGGIQWESFPPDVADEKTARELALIEKAAMPANSGITDKDDPALLHLGEILVRFLRQRDANIYVREALVTADLLWAQMQRSGAGGPTRQELEQAINSSTREQTEIARSMLARSAEAGLNLTNAEVRIAEVSIARLQHPNASGSLDGLMGEKLKLKLAIKSDGKSKTGASLSGDYVVAVNEVLRFGDEWKVQSGIHWYRVPAGVLDEKAAGAMEFENYVAENHRLPPASAAPEIEFTTLAGEKKVKLSELRGKVVILDFWATWCGPCQKPMADLQQLRQAHPDWAEKVAIVPLSIDDSPDIVRRHVDKRGWTNTFNVWAGDGGWQSSPAKAFRVSMVPTTYIIDASGKIIEGGHPFGMAIDQTVNEALRAAR